MSSSTRSRPSASCTQRAARRAARAADRGVRRSHVPPGERRVAPDVDPGRCRRHGADGGRVLVSTLVAALNVQTVVDGVGIGAIYALMAVGIGLVFGVLRLVNFAYGQLVMAGAFALALASEWNAAASSRLLSSLADDDHGAPGLPPSSDSVTGGDARRDLRRRVPAAGDRAALVRRAGKPATALVSLNRLVSIGDVDVRRITLGRDRRRGRRAAAPHRVARTHEHQSTCARPRSISTPPGCWACGRIASSGQPFSSPTAPGRHGRGAPDRAEPARDAGIRVQRDDRRAGGRRARRDEQAVSATLGGFAIGFVSGVPAARCRPTRASTCRRCCSAS